MQLEVEAARQHPPPPGSPGGGNPVQGRSGSNASVGDFPHAPSPRHSQSAVPVVRRDDSQPSYEFVHLGHAVSVRLSNLHAHPVHGEHAQNRTPSPRCAWPDGSSSTGPSRLTCWTTSRRDCIDCWTGRHVRPPAGQPRHRGRYHEGRQEGTIATLRDLVTLKFGAEVAARLPALLEGLSEADRVARKWPLRSSPGCVRLGSDVSLLL